MNEDFGQPQGDLTQTDSNADHTQSSASHDAPAPTAQEIHELEKLERFKFQGQEFTPQALKEAMLRQQDYTKKTQKFAEERRAFESERQAYKDDQKYSSNLQVDLNKIRSNPQLAQEFLNVYPQKYHQELFNMLKTMQTGQPNQPQGPSVFELQTQQEIQALKKFYNDQEVQKNESMISQKLDAMSKKYPEADVEKALARVNDMFMKALNEDPNAKLSDEQWEQTFRAVEEQEQAKWKTKYSELVKKQQSTNDKYKDAASGGGTVGRAPQTFTKLSDVTKYAAKSLSQR